MDEQLKIQQLQLSFAQMVWLFDACVTELMWSLFGFWQVSMMKSQHEQMHNSDWLQTQDTWHIQKKIN